MSEHDFIWGIDQLLADKQFEMAKAKVTEKLDQIVEDELQYTDLLHRLAQIHYYLGQYPDGIEVADREIKIREKLRIPTKKLAKAYQTRGVLKHLNKQYASAYEDYKRGLAFAQQEKADHDLLDQILYSCANICQHYLGKYEKAYSYYSEALKLARQDNNGKQAFYTIHQAMSQISQNNFNQASKCLEIGLELFEMDKDKENYDPTSHMFAKLERVKLEDKRGNWKEAIRLLLPIAEEVIVNPDPYARVATYLIIVRALNSQQLDENALSQLKSLGIKLNKIELVDTAISFAEESKNVKFMVEAYCEKANIQPELRQNMIQKANVLLKENRIIPAMEIASSLEEENNN